MSELNFRPSLACLFFSFQVSDSFILLVQVKSLRVILDCFFSFINRCISSLSENPFCLHVPSIFWDNSRVRMLGNSFLPKARISEFSHSVVSDSLWPHEPQHTRPPCPSPTPRVHPNPCPSSRWCHPTISSSVVPFSSCLQYFPASGSFPMSQLFTSGGQRIKWYKNYYEHPIRTLKNDQLGNNLQSVCLWKTATIW